MFTIHTPKFRKIDLGLHVEIRNLKHDVKPIMRQQEWSCDCSESRPTALPETWRLTRLMQKDNNEKRLKNILQKSNLPLTLATCNVVFPKYVPRNNPNGLLTFAERCTTFVQPARHGSSESSQHTGAGARCLSLLLLMLLLSLI